MNVRRVLMLVLMTAAVCLVSAGVGAASDVKLMLAGSYDTPGYAYDVAVSGSYAYVADANGLVIIDISNPAAPALAGSYNAAGDAILNVVVSGSYAYVTDKGNGFVIIDISNPAAPVLAGSYDTAGDARGVAVSGSYAYVADYTNGLVIIDISNPAAPALAGSSHSVGNAHDVTVSGSYAYVADYTNGLVIIDISNPTAPVLAGRYDAAEYALDVAVSGSYAYVANRYDGLFIVDISNPAAPATTGGIDVMDDVLDVTVSGSYAYVSDKKKGLVIIDISNPTAPALASSYDTAGDAHGVAVSGSYAYVADNKNGLVILTKERSFKDNDDATPVPTNELEITDIDINLDRTPDDVGVRLGMTLYNTDKFGEQFDVPEDSLAVYEGESFDITIKAKMPNADFNMDNVKVVILPPSIYTGNYYIQRAEEPHVLNEEDIGEWKFTIYCLKGIINTDISTIDMQNTIDMSYLLDEPDVYKFRAIAYTEEEKTIKSSKPVISFYDVNLIQTLTDTTVEEMKNSATMGLYSLLKIEDITIEAFELFNHADDLFFNANEVLNDAQKETSQDFNNDELDEIYTFETYNIDVKESIKDTPGLSTLSVMFVIIITIIFSRIQ